eukprot:10241851-Heterocapsa_arctica.AAC.1
MECDHLASLWDFAGRPPMAGLVPSRRSPGWVMAMSALRWAVRADFKAPPPQDLARFVVSPPPHPSSSPHQL